MCVANVLYLDVCDIGRQGSGTGRPTFATLAPTRPPTQIGSSINCSDVRVVTFTYIIDSEGYGAGDILKILQQANETLWGNLSTSICSANWTDAKILTSSPSVAPTGKKRPCSLIDLPHDIMRYGGNMEEDSHRTYNDGRG